MFLCQWWLFVLAQALLLSFSRDLQQRINSIMEILARSNKIIAFFTVVCVYKKISKTERKTERQKERKIQIKRYKEAKKQKEKQGEKQKERKKERKKVGKKKERKKATKNTQQQHISKERQNIGQDKIRTTRRQKPLPPLNLISRVPEAKVDLSSTTGSSRCFQRGRGRPGATFVIGRTSPGRIRCKYHFYHKLSAIAHTSPPFTLRNTPGCLIKSSSPI